MTDIHKKTPIFIASDHAGVDLKEKIKHALKEWQWEDLGPSDQARVDYPDYAHALAQKISSGLSQGQELRGVLICGSGIGMAVAANKVPGIRAASVESLQAAKLSREHNNANVLCLGARLLEENTALSIVRVWLETPFSKDERHQKRILKIQKMEGR